MAIVISTSQPLKDIQRSFTVVAVTMKQLEIDQTVDPAIGARPDMALGAQPYQPVTQRGEGFITASVVDPFGNILGIMYNRHYLDVLGARNT